MRALIHTALAVALAAAAAPSALAQRRQRSLPPIPITITGQVRVARGDAPAERALVRLETSNGEYVGEVETDRTGKFRFTNLSPVRYVVTARAPGYEAASQQVDLQTSSTEHVQLRISPEPAKSSSSPAASPLALSDPNVPLEAQKEFELGRSAVARGRLDEGLAHLGKAVRLYPNFYEAHLLIGTAQMDARRWDESAEALARAAEVNPKSAAARFALGEVQLRRKKFDEAERALAEGLRLEPRSALGHFTLGRVHWERGDYVKAGPEVGRALQLNPQFAEAHLLAGNILLRARQAENALTEFEEYLRLAPDGEFAPQARQMVQKIKQALAEKK